MSLQPSPGRVVQMPSLMWISNVPWAVQGKVQGERYCCALLALQDNEVHMLCVLPRPLRLEEGQQCRITGRKVKKQEQVYKGQKAKLSFYIQFIFSPLKRAQGLEIMIEFFNFINGRLCGCQGNLTQRGKKWPNAVLSGLICCLEIVGFLSTGLLSPSCSAGISTTTVLT